MAAREDAEAAGRWALWCLCGRVHLDSACAGCAWAMSGVELAMPSLCKVHQAMRAAGRRFSCSLEMSSRRVIVLADGGRMACVLSGEHAVQGV